MGLKNGNIVEYDLAEKSKEVIMSSHHDGEVWGLAVMPGQGKFITSGDDNKLLMYDIKTKKVTIKGQVIAD